MGARAPSSDARFVFERLIGSGASGDVHVALDRERGTTVAVKTLRNVDGEALYAFKREFRALLEISHPNLVALGDLVGEGDTWSFSMELIDGVDFLQHARTSE